MLDQVQQAKTIFEHIQLNWSKAFCDADWHIEQLEPKPNYHNRIMILENHPILEKAGIACSTLAPALGPIDHPEAVIVQW